MEQTRMIAFMIYEVYKNYSDEDHPINSVQIQKHLKEDYGIDINRGTLLNHIKALTDYGIEIHDVSNQRDGKYLIDRQLEKSEVYVLSNAIHSAHFIPKNNSADLINKLLETQSIYFKKRFHSTVHIENPRKSANQDFFFNIEMILEAIDQKNAISFQYMRYNYKKKLVRRDEKLHTAYPYYIVTENGNTYLLCKHVRHMEKIIHYRIDKISHIQILSAQTIPPLSEPFDPYAYTSTKPFMFGGETKHVIMRCHKSILDDIIDQFGNKIMPRPEKGKDTFLVKVDSSSQGIIYFALQYMKYCEVLEPKDIRDEITVILKNSLETYTQQEKQ